MGKGSTLRIDIIADGSKASQVMDAVSGKAGRFGKALAVGAAAGAAGVAVAAGGIAVAAIKSASAVEQAYGATDSVFGKYAASVKKAAAGAADSVGLAASEYAGLANVLGSQLKNMGTSADKLGPKTDQLIKQGADLAATFGGSTADAVSAVSSLLKGERDPIEKYGVSIKAADVAARLQAQGLGELTGPAKAAAEAQATLALLTAQTTSAQGAFTRESGTAAGQQQRLTAQWENAKVSLGQGLLPVVTKVATWLSSKVMPAVQGAAGTLATKLGPAITRVSTFVTGTLVPALGRVSAFIQTKVIPAARSFIDWFQNKIAPGIRSAVTPVIDGLRSAFASVQAAVQRNRPQLEAIGRTLRTVAEFIAAKVAPVVGAVLGGAFKVMGKSLGFAIDLIGAMVDGIKGAVSWIEKLIDAAGSIGGALKSGLGKLNPFGFMSSPMAAPGPTATGPASLASTLTGGAQPLLGAGGSSQGGRALDVTVAPPTVNYNVTVNVDGALDPVAVAEQIRTMLLAQAKRMGRSVVTV